MVNNYNNSKSTWTISHYLTDQSSILINGHEVLKLLSAMVSLSAATQFINVWVKFTWKPMNHKARNTLDCHYNLITPHALFIYFLLYPTEFGPTGNSAIQSADPKKYARTKLEVDRMTRWGEITIQNFNWKVGRSSVRCWSVVHVYLHCSHILLFATLGM